MKKRLLGIISFFAILLSLTSCNVAFVSSFEKIDINSHIDDPVINNHDLDEIPYYGYNDLLKYDNGSDYQKFYIDIYNSLKDFDENKKDAKKEAITTNGVDGYHTLSYNVIDKISYSDYEITKEEAISIWRLVGLDHPEYYWLDGQIITNQDKKTITLLALDDYYLYEKRITANTKINGFINSLNTLIEDDYTKRDKILTIHNFIINKANYAYNTNGEAETEEWAHNLAGIPVYKKGVCEAYAKLFTYLCRINNIQCITVTGIGVTPNGSDNHAWNYVEIDGSWYPIDTTWNDTSESMDYYCIAKDDFLRTHIETKNDSLSGVNYLYQLPTLSEIGLG